MLKNVDFFFEKLDEYFCSENGLHYSLTKLYNTKMTRFIKARLNRDINIIITFIIIMKIIIIIKIFKGQY